MDRMPKLTFPIPSAFKLRADDIERRKQAGEPYERRLVDDAHVWVYPDDDPRSRTAPSSN